MGALALARPIETAAVRPDRWRRISRQALRAQAWASEFSGQLPTPPLIGLFELRAERNAWNLGKIEVNQWDTRLIF